MNKNISIVLRLLVGLGIISFLLYRVGVKEIYQTTTTIKPAYLFLYLAAVFVSLLMGAYKLKVLIDALKKLKFAKVLRYYLLSWSTGLFVPGRLGEFILVYFLKKEDIDVPKGTAVTLLDKIIIFTTLSAIAVFGFFIFFIAVKALQLMSILLTGFGLLGLVFASKRVRSVIKKYVLRKYANKFSGLSETVMHYLKKQRKALALNYFWTSAKWLLTAVGVVLLFAGLGQKVSVISALMILAIGAITTIIPITLSGLGIRESVAVFLFMQLGVAAEITLTVFLIMLIINYLIAAISLSALKWGS
jgi:hypothetical protein